MLTASPLLTRTMPILENNDDKIHDALRGAPAVDASAKLNQEANQIGMTGVSGHAARLLLTTGDGLAHLPEGLKDAASYQIHHPLEALETVAGSATVAAALKIALP